MTIHPIDKVDFADVNLLGPDAIVEVPVLLESWQLSALEAAAAAHGLTAGTLVRCLLRDYLSRSENDPPCSCAPSDTPNQEDDSVCLPLSPTGRGE
jgi:hypothetical protein